MTGKSTHENNYDQHMKLVDEDEHREEEEKSLRLSPGQRAMLCRRARYCFLFFWGIIIPIYIYFYLFLFFWVSLYRYIILTYE